MINKDRSTALGALLEAEHDALLSGDFARISAISEEKETLLQNLHSDPNKPSDLQPIKEQIERNHRLFDQSLAGLRAVAARIGMLASGRKNLSTYDINCKRQSLDSAPGHTLEKRA